jgi:sulfatase modifying factor 1
MLRHSSHPLSTGHAPDWARAWGEDRYGVWAAFEVGGVSARLRWIPPGVFVMGSPKDEPSHADWGRDETQHVVELTSGYWLATTPVTQALWEAVLGAGANESRFRHPERPVENVSWEDVDERFLPALEERCPGLGLRFPTEAEWEYACRAGTRTATYAGPLDLHGEFNAPILDPIAWYGGNSGFEYDLAEGEDSSAWPKKQYRHRRAGTRVVGLKRPNAFGLQDMLGNVWEWCQDWYAEYPRGRVADPCVWNGGSLRVLRGGAWDSSARTARSTSRGHAVASNRHWNSGFRPAGGRG